MAAPCPKGAGALLLLFLGAALTTALAVYWIPALLHAALGGGSVSDALSSPAFPLAASLTLAVILLGSLLHHRRLTRQGCFEFCIGLGGRLPASERPLEAPVRAAVERLAAASGLPAPAVFILEGEEAIETFSLCDGEGQSAVVLTRGCLEQLTPEELSAVAAHGLGRVLSGEARLRVFESSVLRGLFLVTDVGLGIMKAGGLLAHESPSTRRSRRRSKSGSGAWGAMLFLVVLLGALLAVAGGIGWLLGRAIQAWSLRGRERASDAFAAELVGGNAALVSALRKVGDRRGGELSEEARGQVGALLLAERGLTGSFAFLAAREPLDARIAALEAARAAPPEPVAWESVRSEPQRVSEAVARPTRESVKLAEEAVSGLPSWTDRRGSPEGARTVVRALFGGPLEPGWEPVPEASRLTLLCLCLPALERLGASDRRQLPRELSELASRDREIDLFELSGLMLLRARLSGDRAGARASDEDRALVLWLTAAVAAEDGMAPQRSFEEGARRLGLPPAAPAFSPEGVWRAVERLRAADASERGRLLEAAGAVALSDGRLCPRETEVLRTLGACLDLPVPLMPRRWPP